MSWKMAAMLCWVWATSALGATIELTGGPPDAGALLRIPVPAGTLAAKPGQVVLLADEKGPEVQAQVEFAGLGGDALELVLVRPVGLGKTLRVGKVSSPGPNGPYAASPEGNRIVTLRSGREQIAVYHVGIRELPAHPDQNRTNFFHPLVTPSGLTVTDDAPQDHLHHRGLFLSFTKVTWTGPGKRIEGNFWHADAAAVVAVGRLHYARGGAVCATLAASHSFTIGGQPVLVQDVIARVARVSPQVNVLDVEYGITAVGGDVELGQNFYSCLQLRGAADFNRPDLVFSYADGQPHRDVDRRQESPPEEPPLDRWLDETGLIGGKPAGAAVAVHPATAKSRTCYSRGVKGLNVDFLYDAPLTIKAGQTLRARYQVYVHDGTAADAKVGDIAAWFNPGVASQWKN
ncbi:MAG: PmoA family protein [Planctomycetota bacterium]|nr:PmoA family protein [Planctomycetota bacterium]